MAEEENRRCIPEGNITPVIRGPRARGIQDTRETSGLTRIRDTAVGIRVVANHMGAIVVACCPATLLALGSAVHRTHLPAKRG